MIRPSVEPNHPGQFDFQSDTLIIGAGACGLIAALSAKEAGQDPLVVEAEAIPSGSTALSAGLIPAAGTRLQANAGIEDSPELFAQDIQAKAHHENEDSLVRSLSENSAAVIEWLIDRHDLPFSLVGDFDYPGHSRRRMHGLPKRSGTELVDALRNACELSGIDIICERRAKTLFSQENSVRGVLVERPDGETESIGCNKLVLACNGFGGNRELVTKHMPEIKDGLWFGHDANRGEAIIWGDGLGAKLHHLGAYQGHGNVAHPHGILISWAVITEGGIQVNQEGFRFWNEALGYSEAARKVLAQPGGVAFTIFDERIAEIARQFEDFKQAELNGAILVEDTIPELANSLGVASEHLAQTIAGLPTGAVDSFGRKFSDRQLAPPYYGVRVTGALFHTQGGLSTNDQGKVLRSDGETFENLYAGGGAACGVSGRSDSGYLSGNGLLSAVVLGRLAGLA